VHYEATVLNYYKFEALDFFFKFWGSLIEAKDRAPVPLFPRLTLASTRSVSLLSMQVGLSQCCVMLGGLGVT